MIATSSAPAPARPSAQLWHPLDRRRSTRRRRQRSPRRAARERAGITLVEAALVLSVAGMVLAAAVPTFVRELETSKATEASELLATLMERSAAYYAVARPTTSGVVAHCLPASAGPTPYAPSADPTPVDFGAPDSPASAAWQALDFAPHRPLRYRYSFTVKGPSCVQRGEPVVPVPQLILRAEGDLDSDGTLSRFERRAKLRDNGVLEPERLLRITDRIE